MAGEPALDDRNAAFWDELCGTNLARELGITDASEESLARFDEAYFALYPYLLGYFPRKAVQGRRLLEIGLGYGTLGEALAWLGANYHGLDLAAAPVAMMRARLARVPGARPEQVEAGLGARAAVRRRRPSTTWSRSAACTTRATFSARWPSAGACSGSAGGSS